MQDRKQILSNNIRAERKRNNLSQIEVASLLDISRETYSRYENGNKVDAMTLYKLSKIFNCSIDAFYFNFNTTNCGE